MPRVSTPRWLDHNGEFQVGPLMPGTYYIRVQTYAWEPIAERPETELARVVLEPGDTAAVRLTVDPARVAMPQVR